jgi:hypothetical protein
MSTIDGERDELAGALSPEPRRDLRRFAGPRDRGPGGNAHFDRLANLESADRAERAPRFDRTTHQWREEKPNDRHTDRRRGDGT